MEDARRDTFEVEFYFNQRMSTDIGLVHERYESHKCVCFGMNSDVLLKVYLLFNKTQFFPPR